MSRNSRENNSEEDLRITLIDFSSRRQSLISGVVRVISEAVEHLKTSLILPKMLENPHTLIRVLTGTQFEPAIHLVTDFQRRREIILKDQRRPLMDHGMIRIIDYFQSNTEMYKLLQGYTHHMTDQDQKLLNAFEMLLETAKRHLDRDAKAQIIEERRLFKLYKESKSLKKSIDRFRIKIASYQTTLRWKLAAKAVYIEKIQRDMDENQLKVEQRIENETDKTQRITRNYKKISLEKQNQLEQELDRARTDYNKLTKEHKGFEKRNRDEKNKLEIKLQSVIKKYDETIGQQILKDMDLQLQLKETAKEMDKLMMKYRKSETIYNDIVIKREEEEEFRKKRRILAYMMNRAARKIQRYWRNWRRHQLKKKRLQQKNFKKQN
ncbi:uncharacterized protein LOC117792056 isoform X2 [Drosophila innubila]|uniref:uncharacterized protein LOC117792056 isoform X2 n=1 Tax=Drosophila innubila TaxID=198719 RepID=UPI00148CFC16|nr:uncharacterized protein LOC117792056 isoform X2 [Drosophila innubila]